MNPFDFKLPANVKAMLPHSVQSKLWLALVDQHSASEIASRVSQHEELKAPAYDFVIGSIDWVHTPQGWEYWSSIHDECFKKETEKC